MAAFSVNDAMILSWLLAIGFTVFGTVRALFALRKQDGSMLIPNEGLQPISILKPLKGLDSGIEENLESFFTLDYPKYEILLSVADADDPVIPIVEKLIRRYPQVSSRLLIGEIQFCRNPKINNLIRSYDEAQFDWILISDSNTRFQRDHLSRLADQFKDGIAMQTSIVAGVDPHGLGGQLESVFLNTFYARNMVLLAACNHPCVMGKSMLFRKSILDRTGGLRAFKTHIAEDYAAGLKLHRLGFRVQLSQDPVQQHIGNYSLATFWSRHIRWGRLRKSQAPLAFSVELLLSSGLSGAIGAVAFWSKFHVSPITFLAGHFLFWFICDLAIAARVGKVRAHLFLPVWILRELVHIPLWLHIAIGNTVMWRGQRIRLIRVRFREPRLSTATGLEEYYRSPDLAIRKMEENLEEVG